MYYEEELLPLSALQHLVFCERQCALIHVEQVWLDNRFTAEGSNLHKRVDEGGAESRKDVRTTYGLRLRSLCLGLTGRADVVQYHRRDDAAGAIPVSWGDGLWIPYPIEYKRGKPKPDRCDEVQLCAQALCLEEMLGASIPAGALYYGTLRRRVEVVFDEILRAATEAACLRLHKVFASGETPPAVPNPKCESCSLEDLCLPKATSGRASAARYLRKLMEAP